MEGDKDVVSSKTSIEEALLLEIGEVKLIMLQTVNDDFKTLYDCGNENKCG